MTEISDSVESNQHSFTALGTPWFVTPSVTWAQRIRTLLCYHRWGAWGHDIGDGLNVRVRLCRKCRLVQVGAANPLTGKWS